MRTWFPPEDGLIVVAATVWGPSGAADCWLALDTAATTTFMSTETLVRAGYDPGLATERDYVVTGSGIEYVPRLPISRMVALGQERTGLPVISHTMPPGARVHGVLGLDFMRDQRLTIDFREAWITLD